jgi:hypothetical protein
LELSINDVLEISPFSTAISRAKLIVSKLRIQNVIILIRQLKAKPPISSTETRWCSKLDMLKRLIKLKLFISSVEKDYPELKITEQQWEAFEIKLKILEPAKVATVALQHQQLTVGDFYHLCCKLKF